MNINRRIQTLDEFTIQQMRDFPQATGELAGLLRDIGLAAKRVNVEVNKAGLVDILGDAGSINVQGEEVKKLDVYANNQFVGRDVGKKLAAVFSDARHFSHHYLLPCGHTGQVIFNKCFGSSRVDIRNIKCQQFFCGIA